jgi:DNA-binding MarR family transcriptional regulator
MSAPQEPRWLNDDQRTAWLGLLSIVNRAFPELERTLKSHDLLNVQYAILVKLSEAPGRCMRLSDLADAANLSQSRLTHRLRALVARGDVEVCDHPGDGRAKNATLTPSGFARLKEVAPFHVEDVQRLLFDPLDEKQTAAMADALSTISDHLCAHPEYLNPKSQP